jgi:Rrf2 family nitric oxide-sensitive transcriptional repressor
MKLTTFTDYGLRVLIFAATAPGERATIAQVAAAYGISENHLVKVVHRLGHLGLLVNTRGRNGGLRLAAAPSRIRLGQVVRALEDGDVPAECFEAGGGDCVIAPSCHLRGALAEAVDAFYAALDRHTLADLVQRRAPIVIALHRTAVA